MDNHCYDFERDSQLLTKLNEFLDTVKGKAMRRWVESIKKVIARKVAVFFSLILTLVSTLSFQAPPLPSPPPSLPLTLTRSLLELQHELNLTFLLGYPQAAQAPAVR